MKRLVTVATFNESENIRALVERISRARCGVDVLVVDDSSPDGTGEVVESLAEKYPRLHLLRRASREGLASALKAGLRWGLEREYEFVVNVDGDLSHDPREIPVLLSAMDGADLAIGSRYWNGIRVINWSPRRLFLSLAAACYVRMVTGMPFGDPTSGFRCFRREALRSVLEVPVISRGYSFHIECLHRIWRTGGNVVEVPILYTDRAKGVTKMTSGIILEALWVTWRLLWQNHCRRRPHEPPLASNADTGRSWALDRNTPTDVNEADGSQPQADPTGRESIP